METIGLIAGNGVFPVLFARQAKKRGFRVVAVAHVGETSTEVDSAADVVEWLRVGRVAKMASVFRRAGVRRAVMAGGIDKTRALAKMRPDWRGLRVLGRAMTRGDDAVLRALADELSRDGIEIVPSTLFLDSLLFPLGHLAGPKADRRALADLHLGMKILEALGHVDVGQSVIVENGAVLAIEAIEGTDAAIRRAGLLGQGRGVLVKAPKRAQDMRFDVPAVGAETIRVMAEQGIKTLACEAGRVLLFDADSVVRVASRDGITLLGYSPDGGDYSG
jgi:DUF1009 family protein